MCLFTFVYVILGDVVERRVEGDKQKNVARYKAISWEWRVYEQLTHKVGLNHLFNHFKRRHEYG